MPTRTINCPNCGQQIPAEIQQLFDVYQNPADKQRLLSGQANFIQCPYCGYQGTAAAPIVYHDPEKELLLTYVPPEINLSRDEQEKIIGTLIKEITNRLPVEMRKGYLFNPQPTFTFQGMLERILEEDGITKEMIQAQQEKLNLLQQLIAIQDKKERIKVLKREDEKIDVEFFALLRQLLESAIASGDQNAAKMLNDIYEEVISETTFGKNLQAQSKEAEDVINELRAAGDTLSREQVLNMVIGTSSQTKLRTIVSLIRPLMDYSFFQLLSEKIEEASGDERQNLVDLREQLLELTDDVDKQIEAHRQEIQQLISQLLLLDDFDKHIEQILPAVDEYFIEELNISLEQARASGDLEKSAKLQEMYDAIAQAAAPSKELTFIDQLLKASSDEERHKMLEENDSMITDDFINALSNLVMQSQAGDNQELVNQIQEVYRQVLRFSMEKSLK